MLLSAQDTGIRSWVLDVGFLEKDLIPTPNTELIRIFPNRTAMFSRKYHGTVGPEESGMSTGLSGFGSQKTQHPASDTEPQGPIRNPQSKIRNWMWRLWVFGLAGLTWVVGPSDVWAWECDVQAWAYRQTYPWLPPALRRLVMLQEEAALATVCRVPTPEEAQALPRLLPHWFREVPQRLYQRGQLGPVLQTLPESARWVLWLHDPAVYREVDPSIRQAFYDFTRRHLEEIPPVFYGYRDPDLEAGRWDRWLRKVQAESREYAQMLARPVEFGLPPEPPAWAGLDFRSTAFGIAALRLQRGISRVVQVWLYLWRQGHGSLRDLPLPYDTGLYVPGRSLPKRVARGE